MGINIRDVICIYILTGNVLWNALDESSKKTGSGRDMRWFVGLNLFYYREGWSKFYLLGNSGEHGYNIL